MYARRNTWNIIRPINSFLHSNRDQTICDSLYIQMKQEYELLSAPYSDAHRGMFGTCVTPTILFYSVTIRFNHTAYVVRACVHARTRHAVTSLARVEARNRRSLSAVNL